MHNALRSSWSVDNVASLESESPQPTDAEIASEVAHVVRGLCQVVATRHFVESHAELIRDVEELQRRVWMQAERLCDDKARTKPCSPRIELMRSRSA